MSAEPFECCLLILHLKVLNIDKEQISGELNGINP